MTGEDTRRGFISQSGLAVGGLLALSAASANAQAQKQAAEGGLGRLKIQIGVGIEAGEGGLSDAVKKLTRLDLISLVTDKPTDAALSLSVKDLRQANDFFAKRAAALVTGAAEAGDSCCCCCPCCCMVSSQKPTRAA